MVRHGDTELPKDLDLIVLPGGFSYGDYLAAAPWPRSRDHGRGEGRRWPGRRHGPHLQRLPGAL